MDTIGHTIINSNLNMKKFLTMKNKIIVEDPNEMQLRIKKLAAKELHLEN